MTTSIPLTIDGINHPIVVRSHPRAKRLTMRVDHNGVIKVTTPRRVSKRKIIHFIKHHQEWIDEQQNNTPQVDLEIGSTLPIEGVNYTIEHISARGVKIERSDDNKLIVSCPIERLPGAVKRYLKKLARDTITPLAHQKAHQIGKTINRIAIKDTKTRWGSCSGKNNLNFSWRIILAPPIALDYLVAHEVAHLEHMNHSSDFWNLCFDLSQDGHTGKTWLRKNGTNLHAYG